ncbi:MAG: ABC transporter permease subunit [Bacteroidales bacterium]|nr:ABC transporter permease subunit [Bacteroidales bacterium]
MKAKKIEEKFFRVLMFLSTMFICMVLFLILFSILRSGLPYLSWEMISSVPSGGYYFGKEGGILNAIIGTLYLSLGSTLLAFVTGLPVALMMNVHLASMPRFVNSIRLILDLLWGIPSIVYGAFGFTIMIYLGIRASLLAGIITVTLFVLPIMIRAMDEALKTVPKGLLETALSLGSTRSEISYRVFFKQCIPGMITAVLLSFGRAAGDVASVLFTTGFTDHIPTSLNQPAATLPLTIFFQLSSPIEEVRQRAFAAAVVLVIIILFISILTRVLSRKYHKNRINF